ncbi:MvaI/BcnI family restriction endonuclease [Sulfurovum sp. XGS-02]|uniref:MvaI/BcnI family restriction endonuclease n=1 Tax=Sulfurovum sp. XGS-02 TaxID=2925411 RepID=UPI002069B398|nr:MvaI/BcnI family restriction endonuclease [Sulfurovum sp. XGS-02]UPT76684.1 MvaI/BcnI family restriction endonuclease [Sulfurovum sp. XGS-02]
MTFTPNSNEEKYIDILDSSTHGEFVLIRMTPTMLNKSIIDASHPLRLLLKENLGIDYSTMEQGAKNGLKEEVELLVNGEIQTRSISYYRPKTKKGDPRFWISRLHNEVKPFDMLLLTVWEGRLYALPLVGDIELFATVLKKIFYVDTKTLPSAVLEVQDMIKGLYRRGWIKTLRAGDTGVGYTFETENNIKENSSKEPDHKGVEIKCSRLGTSTLQTLFSRTPNYSDLPNKRKDLVVNYGYWDSEKSRYALYMTIKVNEENSKGWKLEFDYEQERIYVVKNGEKVVFYEYSALQDALAQKHKRTVFIKAQSQNRKKKNDTNEEFLYESAFYCEDSSFINFIALMEEGKVSLDFAIHHSPETGKTRDHGFLWRISKEFIPLLFKRQVQLCIKDSDCQKS